MGVKIFGFTFFNLSQKVTYGDAFLTIAVVCAISLGLFFLAKHYAPK